VTGPVASYVCSYSPDGRRLAFSSNQEFVVWDFASAGPVARFTQPHCGMASAAFSPDGREIVVADEGGSNVRILDANTFLERRRCQTPSDTARSPSYTPDGRFIVGVGEHHTVTVWRAEDGRIACNINTGRWWQFGITAAAGPDGRTLVTGHPGTALRFWDIPSGVERPARDGHTDEVIELAWSPDGTMIATDDRDKTIRLWDAVSGRQRHRLTFEDKWLARPRFLPDGRLVTISDMIIIWDARKGRALDGWLAGNAVDVAFDRAGKFIVTYSSDTLLTRTNLRGESMKYLGMFDGPHELASVPGPRPFAALGYEKVEFMGVNGHARAGRVKPKIVRHADSAAVTVSADGSRVAFARIEDRTIVIETLDTSPRRVNPPVRLYAPATADDEPLRLGTPVIGPQALLPCALSPDGRLLATNWPESEVRVWEVATGREVLRFQGRCSQRCALAFSPDGTRLAGATDDSSVLIWDVTDARCDGGNLGDDTLWENLGSADGRLAYRTQRTLARDPGRAVPLLRVRLDAERRNREDRIRRCVADLDGPSFAGRERATKELAMMDVGDMLRLMAEEHPSAEVRRRAGSASDRQREWGSPPELARHVRAVAALEQADTPAARQLLATLADGDPNTLATQEAQSALIRLALRRNGTEAQ
jgi:WD40 repeat protein